MTAGGKCLVPHTMWLQRYILFDDEIAGTCLYTQGIAMHLCYGTHTIRVVHLRLADRLHWRFVGFSHLIAFAATWKTKVWYRKIRNAVKSETANAP